MNKGLRGLPQFSKRNIARKPLKICIGAAVVQPVVCSKLIGHLRIAFAHQLANKAAPPARPAQRLAKIFSRATGHHLGHSFVFCPAMIGPEKLFIPKPRMPEQRRRHSRNQSRRIRCTRAQPLPRLRQSALLGTHQRQHAADIVRQPAPKRHIKPRLMMRGQQIGIILQILGLQSTVHVIAAPCHHKSCLRFATLTRSHQRSNITQNPTIALRWKRTKKCDALSTASLRNSRFAHLRQPRKTRPMRVVAHKAKRLFGAAFACAQLYPLHQNLRFRSSL